MSVKVLVVVLSFFVVATKQVDHARTQAMKDCYAEMKADEETMRDLLAKDTLPEDNELVNQFADCFYRDLITDTNELIVDDRLMTKMADIYTMLLDGDRNMGTRVAENCVQHCREIKGDTKTTTAIKITNCTKKCYREHNSE